MIKSVNVVNTFLASVTILYPLKTPENQICSGVFRGYNIGTLARNALIKLYVAVVNKKL